jgi:hypothetical protein
LWKRLKVFDAVHNFKMDQAKAEKDKKDMISKKRKRDMKDECIDDIIALVIAGASSDDIVSSLETLKAQLDD